MVVPCPSSSPTAGAGSTAANALAHISRRGKLLALDQPAVMNDSVPALSGATWMGHVRELRDDRIALLARLAQEPGDLVRLRVWTRPMIVALSPRAVHDVLADKAKSFEKALSLRMLLHPLGGDGLFTSEGELWRRQ